jgi:hypothetical protein
LEVVYKLTREDVEARTSHQLIHSKEMRRLRRMYLLMFVAGVILICGAFYLVTDPRMVGLRELAFVLGAPAGVLIMLPLFVVTMPWRKTGIHLPAEWLQRETGSTRRLRLATDNLIHATDAAVTATPWAAVEKVVTTTDHVYFHTAGAGILVLPRRAFSRDSEFADFVETANQRLHSL